MLFLFDFPPCKSLPSNSLSYLNLFFTSFDVDHIRGKLKEVTHFSVHFETRFIKTTYIFHWIQSLTQERLTLIFTFMKIRRRHQCLCSALELFVSRTGEEHFEETGVGSVCLSLVVFIFPFVILYCWGNDIICLFFPSFVVVPTDLSHTSIQEVSRPMFFVFLQIVIYYIFTICPALNLGLLLAVIF